MEKNEYKSVESYKPIIADNIKDHVANNEIKAESSPDLFASKEADGADVKMLADHREEANSPVQAEVIDIKMSTNDIPNGDAKLEIGEKTAFAGLSKDELMKYANDPFWVRLRWFLFITFWVLWLTMLFGAVMIIYAAPKCDPPPPKTWWQEGPLVQADSVVSEEELLNVQKSGVKGLIIPYPIDSYTTIDNNSDVAKILKKAKDIDFKVILRFDPSTSSKWFNESEANNIEFNDRYIWRASSSASNPLKNPPNSWLSPLNITKPAWLYSTTRGEYYYAPYGQPHLNFRSENVVNAFINVIKETLQLGANGIFVKDVSRLLVSSTFDNEKVSPQIQQNTIDLTYDSYIHNETRNLVELGPLLWKWREAVKEVSNNEGVFSTDEELDVYEPYRFNGVLTIDLPLEAQLFDYKQITAKNLVTKLNKIFDTDNNSWPLWKYNNSEVLDVVVFLLPGTPLLQLNHTPNMDLVKIRNSPSILMGTVNYEAVGNGTLFTFVRLASGNPGIVVAFNPTVSSVFVDLTKEIRNVNVTSEVTVMLTSGYNNDEYAQNMKTDARSINIPSNAAIVLSYVPHLN